MDFKLENEIFLVFTDLDKITVHLISYLIEKGNLVRVVVNDLINAKTIFAKNIDKFESIIECNLLSQQTPDLEPLFMHNYQLNKKVGYVVSFLSQINQFPNDIMRALKHKIDIVHKLKIVNQIERFILITSFNASEDTSTYFFFKFFLSNEIILNKYKAEKLLRESGIKYLIIRHSKLLSNDLPTAFTLDQGVELKGCISSATVGQIAIDTTLDPWIMPNTSLECTSNHNQIRQDYQYFNSIYTHLRKDNDEIELKRDKELKSNLKNIKGFLLIFVMITVYGTKLFLEKYFSLKKTQIFFKSNNHYK